jgi:hypothetical protein
MAHRPVKFFQVGSFAVGNRLLEGTSGRCRRTASGRTR